MGDFAQIIGWRTPINTTAQAMRRGATGDPAPWHRTTGILPHDIEAALASEPASVQERWFVRLYALVFGVFCLFWIVTGIISLGPGWDIGMSLLQEGGLEGNFAASWSALPSFRGHQAATACGPHLSFLSFTW
jgi:hypothetical protein